MDKVTADMLNNLRTDINEALTAVGEKYGLDLRFRNARYKDMEFNAKIEGTLKKCNGKSVEQLNFEMTCSHYGFKPSDYNKTFNIDGKRYAVKGFNPKKRKYPVKCVDVETNECRNFTAAAVQDFIG